MHTAILDGDAQLFSLILAKHPDLSAGDVSQNTPLHTAAALGRADFADALLGQGADALARNGQGEYASALAFTGGHAELGEKLYWEEMRRLAMRYGVPILIVLVLALSVARCVRLRKRNRCSVATVEN